MDCYCESGLEFKNCCQPFLKGDQVAPSAEALMRSRYSAFATENMDYLLQTHDPQTRQEFDLKSNQDWAQSVQFLGLEIIGASQNGNKGTVEFKARFADKTSQQISIHHEISKFRHQKGIWYFRGGKMVESKG